MILTAGPSITNKEIEYVNDAVKNGWNENWNSYLVKLESAFKEKFNKKFALLTSSCTGGMHMGMRALDIREGDEVIVPELTWVATASAPFYLGAKPIFVDVDKDTWTIDIESAESKITNKTKAIMPVHLYGHPSNMEGVMYLAEKYNLKVLEDAAPAIGAKFKNDYCSTFGDVSVFSFQGAKMMVTGEGGIVLTDDEEVFSKIKQYSEHGRSTDPNKTFWIETIGYKYKMSNIQAALGLAQFERLDELIDRKREIFKIYKENLVDTPLLSLNEEADWAHSIYWMTSIVLQEGVKINRDEMISRLKQDGVDSRPVFPTISKYPMWKSDCVNPNAEFIGSRGINLPSGHNLKESEIIKVCSLIKKYISN
jgi:perosamine synthetase